MKTYRNVAVAGCNTQSMENGGLRCTDCGEIYPPEGNSESESRTTDELNTGIYHRILMPVFDRIIE